MQKVYNIDDDDDEMEQEEEAMKIYFSINKKFISLHTSLSRSHSFMLHLRFCERLTPFRGS
jgi:hypothetical protein